MLTFKKIYLFSLILFLLQPQDSIRAQEQMELLLENNLSDARSIDLNLKLTGNYEVLDQKLKFWANPVSSNASLQTLEKYKDILCSFELNVQREQLGPVVFYVRGRSQGQEMYAFYIYPNGVVTIDHVPNSSGKANTILGKAPFKVVFGETYCVKVRAVEQDLTIKIWSKDTAEPDEWLIAVKDKTLSVAGRTGIEIQRGNTPGKYAVELANLKIWGSTTK